MKLLKMFWMPVIVVFVTDFKAVVLELRLKQETGSMMLCEGERT